jgi:hypothetical protein
VAEWATYSVKQARECNFLGFDCNRTGLDLGEVENITDQIEQIGTSPVNGASEFNLLRVEISIGVVGELSENQMLFGVRG